MEVMRSNPKFEGLKVFFKFEFQIKKKNQIINF